MFIENLWNFSTCGIAATENSVLQLKYKRLYLTESILRKTTHIMKSSIFWDMTLCSPLKVNWCFRGTHRFHLQGQRIFWARYQHESRLCLAPASSLASCSAYSSTLKMEVICFCKTLVDFQRTTKRFIPKDSHDVLTMVVMKNTVMFIYKEPVYRIVIKS
jgi:hypothetical protein